MPHPMDCTAAELADRLDYLTLCEPSAGMASILDEAALPFARKSGEVALAYPGFSSARSAHQCSYSPAEGDYSPDAWMQVIDGARCLAKALRTLGDMAVARCPKCGVSLGDDGVCRMPDDFHRNRTA